MEVETTEAFVCLPHDKFCDLVVETMKQPIFKAMANRTTTRWTEAEDMLSETVVRAIEHREYYRAGTNIKAWLLTIMRNAQLTKIRKYSKRETWMGEGQAERIPISASAHHALELKETLRALDYMSRSSYEAFELVVLEEMSYEEAAIKLNCAVGTIKSRVSRGQTELHQYFGLTKGEANV